MNLPSKTVNYSESVLSKFPVVLQKLPHDGINATTLYFAVSDKMRNVSEFINVLDCLYVLGKIEIDNDKEMLHRAD